MSGVAINDRTNVARSDRENVARSDRGEEKSRIVDVQNVKPYRSPRQRRQVLIAMIVVLIAAAMGAGAYLLLAPRAKTYTLRTYDTAKVQKTALVQSTQESPLSILT